MGLVKAWLPILAYGVLIYLFSAFLQPGNIQHPWDWGFHLLEFSICGFLAARALLLSGNIPRWLGIGGATLLGLIFGVLDEVHQSMVPGRNATVMDALVDGLGSWLGASLYVYLGEWLFRKKWLYETPNPCEGCPSLK